ncbi:MAG: hypothetical protein GY913_11185 [Proteobacteria bacterium]|nr:hypothetical protein [Pseudomonadota bacterium]MCP4917477.1 hypothetical protein [Pseudomonadota bacterium]
MTSFFGRDRELAWLRERLERTRCAVGLFGGPGVGKSRLLVEALGPESVRVDVPERADDLEARVAAALGVAPGADVAERVPLALRGRTIGLDAVELSDGGWMVLAEWVRDVEGLRLVLATRVPPPRAGWDEFLVEPLEPPDALALFCARSGRPADPAARHLVDELACVPLAVELAAARARLLGAEGVRRHLSLELLADRLDPTRSMAAALAWSWGALEPPHQEAALRLSLFDGPISIEAAMALLGDATLDQLEVLHEQAWLVRSADGLRMPFAAREFARRQGAEDRRAAWVSACLAAAAAARSGKLLSSSPVGGFPLHADDVQVLVHHASGEDFARAVCVMLSDRVGGFDDQRDQAVGLLAQALEMDLPADLRGELLLLRAERFTREPASVPGWLAEARALLQDPDAATRGRLLSMDGVISLLSARYAQAAPILREALASLPEPARSPLAQRVLGNLGFAVGASGDRHGAIQLWEQLLAIGPERTGSLRHIRTLANLAQTATTTRLGEGAPEYLTRGMELAEAATLPQFAAYLELRRIQVQVMLGGEIPPHVPDLLVRAGTGSDRMMERDAHITQCGILVEGDLDAAERALDRAAEIVTFARHRLRILTHRVQVAALRGDLHAARRHHEAWREDAEDPVEDGWLQAHWDPTVECKEPQQGDLFEQRDVALLRRSRRKRLEVDPDGFSHLGVRVDLSRRGPARRILWRLALDGPGDADALIEAGWPGERIRWQAAKNRLHVTLSLLRKLGLKDVLVCVDGVYRLDVDLVTRQD